MKEVKYVPKSGVEAGKRNFEAIKKYLADNPDATGREVAKAVGVSLPTAYSHLKKLQ